MDSAFPRHPQGPQQNFNDSFLPAGESPTSGRWHDECKEASCWGIERPTNEFCGGCSHAKKPYPTTMVIQLAIFMHSVFFYNTSPTVVSGRNPAPVFLGEYPIILHGFS